MATFELKGTNTRYVSNADYVLFPKLSQSEIDALSGIIGGEVVYNTDILALQGYNGIAWTTLSGGGGSGLNVVKVFPTGNTTAASLANTQYYYSFTATGTLTLPTAVGNNSIYIVKNKTNGNINVVFTGGQNADENTNIIIVPNQSLTFISNNVNYEIN